MNYQLRPEWAPQRGVLIVWPHAESDWRDSLSAIQAWYARFVAAVTPTQDIYILCFDAATEHACRENLSAIGAAMQRAHTVIIPSNDTWIRDFGPLSLNAADTRKAPTAALWADFRFNAWGGKYPYDLDNQVCEQLAQLPIAKPLRKFDWILEGGAIDINDDGVLLTTANCMLNNNRNHFGRDEIERELQSALGAKEVLILQAGFLLGDDTDSHVDNLVRFVDNRTIVYCHCKRRDDPHYIALQEMQAELQQWNQAREQAFNLIPIELPAMVIRDGERLAASYVNFLILNQVVIVPGYHDSVAEQSVMQQLQDLFPTRRIVRIANSADLVVQGGGPHCASMQFG